MAHAARKIVPSAPADSNQTAHPSPGPAYTVYVFPENRADGTVISWERAAQTRSRREALASAQNYFETARYDRVEVQETVFSARLQKPQIRVVKCLRHGETARRFEDGLRVLLVVAAAVTAFVLSAALMMATIQL